MDKIRIAIADDYAIFRDGLKVGLKPDRNLQVVLEAENGVELLEGMEKQPVDVILMDLKMPLMDGVEATREVKKRFNTVKVLTVTMYDDPKFIIHLMENGANGYLLKNAEPEEIRTAIHAAHETGYYFNEIVNKALLKKLIIKGNIKPSFNQQVDFTEREMEVLKLICAEKTTPEISKEIFLSPRSVEGIRLRLIEKTGARNTVGLVMFAIKNGLV